MIPLIIQNANVLVWNAEDWKKLRKEHRIVGNLMGSLPRAPFQNTFSGLPCSLLDEEVAILLEKGLAKLVKYKSFLPSPLVVLKWQTYKAACREEQANFIINERKRSITSMIDKIVEGKQKKINIKKSNNSLSSNTPMADTELDKENILRTELERVEQTTLNHNLVLTFCEDPWLQESDFEEVTDWKYPKTKQESLKFRVFKDLWEKGYYVTCGQKFGGDFLIYPGDPVLYHAHYIVLCKDNSESFPWLEIASHCRVASSARKTYVIASPTDQDTLSYTSFQFENMARCFS